LRRGVCILPTVNFFRSRKASDGEMPSETQYAQWQQRGPVGAFTAFADRAAFINWPAGQRCDVTLLPGANLAE